MPVSVVQTAIAQFTTAASKWTVTFASAVAQNNVVVILGKQGTGGRTMNTPTGGGGTFSSVVSNSPTAYGGMILWAKQETNSSVTSYSVSITGGSSAYGSLTAIELSGVQDAVPGAGYFGTGTQSTTTTSPQMLDTGIDIPANGIMIGGISTNSSISWGTLTDPTNFTRLIGTNTGQGQPSCFIGYRTASGTAIQGIATTTTARAVLGVAAVWIESGRRNDNLLLLGVG